ncbi:PREDICTED: pathogenesis-related protein 1-like [Nelumbo nucifera]|uniref:Bet v I/Major latex protein domain-containing protein n=2 Tax=Nelumbo nucifera TaxID=4432 RepID=A0A822ZTZ4_NELNU|nr:PREDICTED: pathogenesis-related protein 1-like [Nelumbo nucifera]DAD46356.1 TPA_asm: hypothetical protein HUJ06_004586 [Nelumbo nucifera]
MVKGSITEEYVSKVSVERLWKASICDAHNLMPKVVPGHIKSIELLEGDGGVGTVKHFHFTDVMKDFEYLKDRVDVIDHANHVFKSSIIEGGLVGLKVKSYTSEIALHPTSDGGCVARVNIEYESINDNLLSDEDVARVKEGVIGTMKEFDGYLLANPEAYA